MIRKRHFAHVLLLTTASSLSLVPSRAEAQDTALAESLFQEGQTLMRSGKIPEACAKLAASYAIESSTGTLINLATCQEKQGKIASAWAAFSKALPQARAEGRKDRARYCQERVEALRPQLSMLKVEISKDNPTEGLNVLLNGSELKSALWGAEMPVDPGVHRVIAEAPGYQRMELSIEVGAKADRKVLSVPALTRAIESTEAQPSTPRAASPESIALDSHLKTGEALPPKVYIAGGAAIALGVGTIITGLMYTGARGDFDDANRSPLSSPKDRQEKRDSASTLGTVSSVLGISSLAAAGITFYLLNDTKERERSVAIAGWVNPAGAGIAVASRF